MVILLVAAIGLVLLAINEWWWRRQKRTDEFSRKFIHLVVGSFVAAWPYFLSWNEIRLLGLLALIAVILSKRFNILRTIHAVTRPTWGEAYFAVAVVLTTYVTQRPAIYAVALLQMSLADGLAAVLGTQYGKPNAYKVFGALKSLVGSGTFLAVSYILLLAFSTFSIHLAIGWCLAIASVATFLENIAPRGLDNLAVPLFVALALRAVV